MKGYLLKVLSYAAALLVLSAFSLLFGFLLLKGLPMLNLRLFFGDTSAYDAVIRLRPVWDGIWPAFAGTFYLLALTMVMALVPGIGCGVFLARFAEGRTRELLSLAVDLLAGVPSIVMGLFGFVLILFMRRTFAPEATTCVLLAAFCLALLVLPSLVVTTRGALESLPVKLAESGRALGFSEKQLLRHLLLPAAAEGILGGVMLAMGRAAEDTAVIMLTGVVINSGLPAGLASKFEALPFLIYYTAAQYTDEAELTRGFGAALVLLLLSSSLLGAAWLLQRGMKRRWRGVR